MASNDGNIPEIPNLEFINSGSIFTALCNYVLAMGGSAEGCTCIVDVLNVIGDGHGSEEPSATTIAGAIDRMTNAVIANSQLLPLPGDAGPE